MARLLLRMEQATATQLIVGGDDLRRRRTVINAIILVSLRLFWITLHTSLTTNSGSAKLWLRLRLLRGLERLLREKA